MDFDLHLGELSLELELLGLEPSHLKLKAETHPALEGEVAVAAAARRHRVDESVSSRDGDRRRGEAREGRRGASSGNRDLNGRKLEEGVVALSLLAIVVVGVIVGNSVAIIVSVGWAISGCAEVVVHGSQDLVFTDLLEKSVSNASARTAERALPSVLSATIVAVLHLDDRRSSLRGRRRTGRLCLTFAHFVACLFVCV